MSKKKPKKSFFKESNRRLEVVSRVYREMLRLFQGVLGGNIKPRGTIKTAFTDVLACSRLCSLFVVCVDDRRDAILQLRRLEFKLVTPAFLTHGMNQCVRVICLE